MTKGGAPQHRVAELAVAESLFPPGHDFLPSIESARCAVFCVLFTVAGLCAGAGRSDGERVSFAAGGSAAADVVGIGSE